MGAGRKREFDREKVLDAAMAVFWKKGYGNTRLSDLTEAMGINKPSLYNVFGNKEGLFIEAIKHYEEGVLMPAFDLLANESDSARQRLSDFLFKSISIYRQGHWNYGCMLLNSVSELRALDIPLKATEVVGKMASTNKAILDGFFAREYENGATASASSSTQTLYLLAMLSGLSVMIRGDALEDAHELIAMTLDTLCEN